MSPISDHFIRSHSQALKSRGAEVRVAEVPKGGPSTSDLCFMMKADHLMGNSVSTFLLEAILLGGSSSSTLYAVGEETKSESWERGDIVYLTGV